MTRTSTRKTWIDVVTIAVPRKNDLPYYEPGGVHFSIVTATGLIVRR